MNSFKGQATQRLFALLAWFVFIFCSGIIVIGFITGSAQTTAAEETAEEQDQAGDDEEVAEEEPAEEISPEADEAQPQAGDETDSDDSVPIDEEADAAPEESDEPTARGPPSEEELDELADRVAQRLATDDDSETDEAAQEEAEEESAEDAGPQIIELGDLGQNTPLWQRLVSFFGIFALLFVAWLLSNNRRKVNWRLVAVGIGLQLAFAVFIFFVPGGEFAFAVATEAVAKLLQFTDDGSAFIFSSFVTNDWEPGLINFAFAVLPTIIFFSSLMTILYYLGVMQKLVELFAIIMQKTMNISGAESTSAAANIFVGQTEAPLVIKPFVEKMTESELMVVMTGGFATVAGGVLAIYVGMLDATFPDIAGHLIAASVMSAPAALVVAKIMYPETGTPETMGELDVTTIKEDVNVLGAASRGAAEGLKLALNVGAMLLAFIALIAMLNYIIGLPSLWYNQSLLTEMAAEYVKQEMTIPDGCDPKLVLDDDVYDCAAKMQAALGGSSDGWFSGLWAGLFGSATEAWISPVITMQDIFGWIFWPFAFIMGVPVEDCHTIGRLLGEKMVINELVAYASLQQILLDPDVVLQERSVIIATYALCGFANFGSIGIQLGGIGGIAPSRKDDLAKIALRAMIGGTIAAFMTATIAGIMI